jgi:hypothetical protein
MFPVYKDIRPNRLEDKKNEEYHLKYSRWALGSLYDHVYRLFIDKTLINWSFYKGGDGQWIFDEDLTSFFTDESGDHKNRLKMVDNVIKPTVLQYVGNAVRMSYNAEAKATSDFAINKRDRELGKLKFFEAAGKAIPEVDGIIRDRVPLGETPIETEELFENSWVDEHEKDVNNMIKWIARDIDLEEIKVNITRNLAISGMGIYKGYEQNGRYRGESIDPLFFIWDTSSRKSDLSDSEYMGEWYYMDVASLFERFQDISHEGRTAIEQWSRTLGTHNVNKMVQKFYRVSNSKIPVYELYWKDVEEQEFAWVKDEFGYPYFTRINHEESEYTNKDIIDAPSDAHEDVLKGKKKAKIYVDILRYCIFIPKEEIGSKDDDIVLEYGELPYQQKDKFDPSSVSFPYKVYTWSFDKGEVMSPIDDMISPQRFMNRVKSVVESQINNIKGSGPIISKDAVDPRDGEEGIVRAVNKSKPVFVDTSRTGSVQNSIGSYGGPIGSGLEQLLNVHQHVQAQIQNTTGVNEAMTGTAGGSDALVGVLQTQIAQGSLVQEPFYWALTSILKQACQHMVTVGKRIYADNPRKLAIMAGDDGMERINITKDDLLEDHKIFIERTEGERSAIERGNQTLFTLYQMGLIDNYTFGNQYNRSTVDNVAVALRTYQKELAQAQNEMDKVNAQRAEQERAAMQQAQQQQAAMQQEMMNKQEQKEALDREHEMNQVLLKEGAKNDREEIKSRMKGARF